MKMLTYVWFLINLIVLSGCNLMQATPVPVIQPTRPYIQIAQPLQNTTGATPTRTVRIIPTQTAPAQPVTEEPTSFLYTCGIEPTVPAIRYEIAANIDYAAKSADISQRTYYLNQTVTALGEVVFDVQPNIWQGAFHLKQIQVNGQNTSFQLSANRLVVPLAAVLNPGCEVMIDLQFDLQIPQIGIGLGAFKGYFGYGERQINLSYWLPTAAARSGNDWIVHTAQAIGEQIAYEQADWNITVSLGNAPENMTLAAPGLVEQIGDQQWRIIHNAARDTALSISPDYRVSTAVTANGITVELYHFADTQRLTAAGNTIDGAVHALTISTQAVEQYSSLFGDYPYSRLIIVQGDFPDGMEFSGLAYVSTAWFYNFEGGADNYLTIITVHEISHQWWYSIVGNDAAITPWLDEALSTYSEYIFIEEFYPELKNWWWSFRVAWYDPQGNVDSTVYEFETVRDYINAVYLRGVQMLHNIREDIGTEAFFDLLAAYVDTTNGSIAASDSLWLLLTEEQRAATSATRAEFLKTDVFE